MLYGDGGDDDDDDADVGVWGGGVGCD